VIGAISAIAAAAAVLWIIRTAREPIRGSARSRNVRLLTYDRPFPAEGRYPGDPYVGSAACSECHAGEAALHARSGHASTLRPAGKIELSRRLDGTTAADPELADVSWSYRYRDGALLIARNEKGSVEECLADYAIGSGHHATTFVSMIKPEIPAILEHRLTYFEHTGALGLTPGHDIKPPPPGLTAHGGVPPPRATRACFGCHATQISVPGGRSFDEQAMIPNVGCERCHGPGRAHVAAARRGARDSELSLPFGQGRWTAQELLRFCGECHRHPEGPRPEQIRSGDPFLARFQPIGLSMSKCYRQSSGTFSCVSCHDPHGRASSDRAWYDTICLKCHGGQAASAPAGKGSLGSDVRCKVSPRDRCVECHMPRVKLGQNLTLSDHWIRIHPEQENEAPAPISHAAGSSGPADRDEP
jgi:hypothetical protein